MKVNPPIQLSILASQENAIAASPEHGLPAAGDGPELLNCIADTYRRYLVLPPGAADALALMVAHIHAYDAFLHTPRLSFQAAEMGCGKSTALALIRTIFTSMRATKLPSAQIVSELGRIEGQPWAEYQGRRSISTHQVAHLLRGFGISPRTVRFGTITAKGYDLDDFKDVFARFLPQP